MVMVANTFVYLLHWMVGLVAKLDLMLDFNPNIVSSWKILLTLLVSIIKTSAGC